MNWSGVFGWGFVGTLVLTTLMAASQRLGLTRLSLPSAVGAMFTPNRDRAEVIGFGVHLVNGWLFATVYAAMFENWRKVTPALGAAIGLVHALFVLIAVMPILPALHPRMASELQGPTPTRQLQPAGFLAANYGYQTPIAITVAHLVYGGLLGAGYRLK